MKRSQTVWLSIIGLIMAVVLLMLSACASVDKGMMSVSNAISSPDPVTGERQINLVSEQEEINKAEEITKQILTEARNKGIKIDGDTEYYDRVVTVFNQLQKVVHRKHLPWEIHVIASEVQNAFTIGGGKVFLSTGMFGSDIGLKTDDELAAVISHEMAHVAARHTSEGTGKRAIAKLADKDLRKDAMFDASFTTIQEDEADKYSVIYSALAGYDPTAGIMIWKRLHNALGSYAGDMLYDHPLNDDRTHNMEGYAKEAQQYYISGKINPDHESLLINNAVFSYRTSENPEAGKGGGVLALLETTVNTANEVLEAKLEEINRQNKQLEQEKLAASRLFFRDLKIDYAQGGGKGLFGLAINPSMHEIKQAFVLVEYKSGGLVVLSEKLPWSAMIPHEKKQFGIVLKQIQYDSVSIRPIYVQLSEE